MVICGYPAKMMSSHVPMTSSVSSPSMVSIMASSVVERVRFQA